MTKYPFIFKVVLYFDGNYRLDSGIGFADSYSDAARILDQEVYRDDLISIQHLELLECGDVLCAPWELVKEVATADENHPLPYCDAEGNLTYPGNEYGHVNDEDAFGHSSSTTPKGEFDF